MKKNVLLVVLLCLGILTHAQSNYAVFPQQQINRISKQVMKNYPNNTNKNTKKTLNNTPHNQLANVLSRHAELKRFTIHKSQSAHWVQLHDTIVVGAVPHDTLKITGYWTHHGPILVVNDGVLIFKHATVIDSGDVYVLQNGKVIADSSSLTFPQQYFYQRSLIAVQHAQIQISNSSFNYSGLSHNLVISGNANVTFNHIHQNDWTTCGLSSQASLTINHCNLAGEYILSDTTHVNFKNTDTILLWHQLPKNSVIDVGFPDGDTVYNYRFNKHVPGVQGLEYDAHADTCHHIMWAIMPTNQTDVTISNSKIRAIGLWFQRRDTVTVSDLYNNSTYTNFTTPLSDRRLRLVNCDLQTWSLYVFDASHIDVHHCKVGEVGTMNHSSANVSQPFLLDGSGGYFWATDTATVFSYGTTTYSYVRSERNGWFVLAYGWVPFSAPQAIGKSVMISLQSNTKTDPVAYESATAWLSKIDGPDTSYVNTQVSVLGSAWIDWGPQGTGWMNFNKYRVYYQLQGSSTWKNIVKDSLVEIRHAPLATWNTTSLASGNYYVKLTAFNTNGDSVEAIKPITLKNAISNDIHRFNKISKIEVYPNPTSNSIFINTHEIKNCKAEIYNALGQLTLNQSLENEVSALSLEKIPHGIYVVILKTGSEIIYQSKLVKE